MHIHAEVYLESLDDWENMVDAIMKHYQVVGDWEPEEDSRGVDYDYSVCFWDWYEVGGRWSGAHKAITYKDYLDKKENKEGAAKKLEENIAKVVDLPPDFEACTLVANGQVFHEYDDLDKGINIKKKLKELGITEGYVVTIDYHC